LDLISFVAVSALVMVSCGYAGFYVATRSNPGLARTSDVPAMVMVSIMILTSVSNFLVIISRPGQARKKTYVFFAAGMVLSYFAAVSLGDTNWVLRFLHKFYEISTIDSASWQIVLIVCAVGSVVLYGAQRLRAVLINRGA